jgi:formylmethanofuran dehydrogenase subunit E
VVGVRLALLGLRLLGLSTPPSLAELKRLIVFVELDRCAADAVAHVTGARLGRRSLKFVDYGIMAATFVDLMSGAAFRVVGTEEARELAESYAPEVAGKYPQQLTAYRRMPDSALFRVQRVKVDLDALDLPGPTRRKVACQACGQVVRDGKEVVLEGRTLCQPCAGLAYFREAEEIALEVLEAAPPSRLEPSPFPCPRRGRQPLPGPRPDCGQG